ncbi:MAG TPA: GNAT family N-acetyltransferase [Candidatus Nanoarchaeia archaeon]|nr:GNAT family N-acetyltransferase [Candidatus Nanoarchaeia archaeon]
MEEQRPMIKPEEIKIEIISPNYNIDTFQSYEKELVDFLREDALENQKQRLSITFLWFYKDQLVSYISLLNDKVNLEGDLKEFFKEKGIHYKSLPALKIGRLCVDNRFLQRGLGRLMILLAIQMANEINRTKAGCRFITLDAKRNPDPKLDSIHFYKKQGFKALKERIKGTTPMYVDLKLIEES